MNPQATSEAGLAATGETTSVAIPAQEKENAKGTPQTRLQDVLPEIKALAQRVGGMKKLQELVATLQESKE